MTSTYSQKSEAIQRMASNNAASLMDSSMQSASLQRKADMIQHHLDNRQSNVVQRLADGQFRVEDPKNLGQGYINEVEKDVGKREYVEVGEKYHIGGRSHYKCMYECHTLEAGGVYVFVILAALKHGGTNKDYKDSDGRRFRIGKGRGRRG